LTAWGRPFRKGQTVGFNRLNHRREPAKVFSYAIIIASPARRDKRYTAPNAAAGKFYNPETKKG
jgi:hypothetical protein